MIRIRKISLNLLFPLILSAMASPLFAQNIDDMLQNELTALKTAKQQRFLQEVKKAESSLKMVKFETDHFIKEQIDLYKQDLLHSQNHKPIDKNLRKFLISKAKENNTKPESFEDIEWRQQTAQRLKDFTESYKKSQIQLQIKAAQNVAAKLKPKTKIILPILAKYFIERSDSTNQNTVLAKVRQLAILPNRRDNDRDTKIKRKHRLNRSIIISQMENNIDSYLNVNSAAHQNLALLVYLTLLRNQGSDEDGGSGNIIYLKSHRIRPPDAAILHSSFLATADPCCILWQNQFASLAIPSFLTFFLFIIIILSIVFHNSGINRYSSIIYDSFYVIFSNNTGWVRNIFPLSPVNIFRKFLLSGVFSVRLRFPMRLVSSEHASTTKYPSPLRSLMCFSVDPYKHMSENIVKDYDIELYYDSGLSNRALNMVSPQIPISPFIIKKQIFIFPFFNNQLNIKNLSWRVL